MAKNKSREPMFFSKLGITPQEARDLAEQRDHQKFVKQPESTAKVDYQDITELIDLSGAIESPMQDVNDTLIKILEELRNIRNIVSNIENTQQHDQPEKADGKSTENDAK